MNQNINIRGDSGIAVLLLHGLCGNPLELQPLTRRLQRCGHSVSVPFINGYGVWQDRHQVTPYESWVEDVRKQIEILRADHEQVLLGGICIGANLAMALAAQPHCGVDGLILISPTLFFDGWNVPRSRVFLPLAYYTPLRYWFRFRERAPFGVKNLRLRAWITEMMQRESASPAGAAYLPATSLYQSHRLIRQVKRGLSQVAIPALILHAVEDDVSSPKNAHFIARHMGSEDVNVHWFHDSFHMLTLDNEREQVADEIIRFLNRLNLGDALGEHSRSHSCHSHP